MSEESNDVTAALEAAPTALATALKLAANGFGILALEPDTLVPLPAAGTVAATTDEAVLRAWWTRWPSARIGVRWAMFREDAPKVYALDHEAMIWLPPGEIGPVPVSHLFLVRIEPDVPTDASAESAVSDAKRGKRRASGSRTKSRPPPADSEGTERPDLPTIDAEDGDLARLGDAAFSALERSNDPPWLFRFGDGPVRVEVGDTGAPRFVPLTVDRLRGVLARVARWGRATKEGRTIPAHPPEAAVRDVLARADLPFPVLHGVVTAPVFGAGGELQTVPGYHSGSRLLYAPAPGFTVDAVPPRPTARQLADARSLLVNDLLGDFPFVSPAERANAVALLLLPFVRPMIGGPTPLHLIEKPAAGTGATLMVNVMATVATGHPPPLMTEARDEEEWRKRITSTLLDTPQMVLVDNVRRTLDSSALAAALTAPRWGDRILGASANVNLPVRCAWIATGNNPKVSNEIARRVVRIRMDARCDQPWARADFRHDDILAFARSRRSDLVWACLVLVQDWIAAGRPAPEHLVRLGSYEEWSAVLGGVLEHCGVPGFLGNLDDFHAVSDAEASGWRAFAAAWWHNHVDRPVTVADLYHVAAGMDAPLGLGEGSERSQRTRLGLRLAEMRDRLFTLDTDAGGPLTVRLSYEGTGTGSQSGIARYRLAPCR